MSKSYFFIEYLRLKGMFIAFGSCQAGMILFRVTGRIDCPWWLTFFPVYIYLIIWLLLLAYVVWAMRQNQKTR